MWILVVFYLAVCLSPNRPSVCLSIHPAIYLFIHLSVCPSLSICPPIHPSVCLFVCLSIHLSAIYLSIHPTNHLSVYLPFSPSIHSSVRINPPIHPSVRSIYYQSVCPSACLSIIQPNIYLSISAHPSIHPSINLSTYLSVCPPLCMSAHLTNHPSIRTISPPIIHLFICLSIHPSKLIKPQGFLIFFCNFQTRQYCCQYTNCP